MLQSDFELVSNRQLTPGMYEMQLWGDTSAVTAPGQFVEIALPGLYLRRPISVCNVQGNKLTLLYKSVGRGTQAMSDLSRGARLNLLTGLGNGYDLDACGDRPLLIGGGAGVPPMYLLARRLIERGRGVTVILGFNTAEEIFYEDEFRRLGARVFVATVDGTRGVRGFVTDAMVGLDYSHICACGPLPMLRAVNAACITSAQFSLEERMGCGFGACMGCTIELKSGPKRVCKDGPVFRREELPW